jgi:hypothetical protein
MTPTKPVTYPLEDIALVIQRHTHDLRNTLNGMKLELTWLDENVTAPASRAAVKRLGEVIAEIGRRVQGLSSKYGIETPSSLLALQIVERWQADAFHLANHASFRWRVHLADETVCVEPGLIRSLLSDVLELAASLGGSRGLQINCQVAGGCVVFEIATQDGVGVSGIADALSAYWAVLGRLAERNQGLLHPPILSSEHCFPMRLSLPLQPGV